MRDVKHCPKGIYNTVIYIPYHHNISTAWED